jgi:PEP-CTERM motif-containing protein
MNKLSMILVVLLVGAMTAHADNLVTSQPVGTDSVDWSQLGAYGTGIPNPFSFTTANSVSGTGTYANPGDSYMNFGQPGEVGSVMQQGVSWGGNFANGDYLNWTENSGPLTLSFGEGYTQIGTQIDADYYGAFTAQICDVNGCFTEDGNSASTGDNSAIYIGISSSAPVTWVTFSLTSASGAPDDFAINDVTLDGGTTATPEPSSLLLFGTGLVGFAGALRRKFAQKVRA